MRITNDILFIGGCLSIAVATLIWAIPHFVSQIAEDEKSANAGGVFGPAGGMVHHDDQRHVTCWQLSYYSLSCIPDSQLGQR